MKYWLLRIAGAVVALVGVAAITAWVVLRASLPQLDGEIPVAGITAPASIVRDAQGIPTIVGKNRRDLAFATGFAHAQDRYFQMDLVRRRAAGELSEIIGAATIAADRRTRFHRFRDRARSAIARWSAENVAILESYTAGVNAGLASLDARPFEYVVLGVDPEPWDIEDTVLVVYAMFLQLNDERATKDVRRGFAARALPAEVFRWMYPEGTSWDAPIMGEPRREQRPPPPNVFSIRDVVDYRMPAGETGKTYLNGSNNWVVGGSLTPDGRALVSNDMHLGHGVPNIWYQVQLISGGDRPLRVTGVQLPGTPFISAGSNGNVAWGYTNSYGDWSDAVLLRPGAKPGTYRTPDGDRPFEIHREEILVKDGDPVEFEIRETIWGPVDEDIDYPDGEIAVSWIGHSAEAVNLAIVGLETATSVGAAVKIAATMGIPPQNFVVGDAGGNIGWTIAGQIPVKGDFDPMIPADWSSEEGWLGWLHPSDYPRVVNPANERIWTANTRVADGEALAAIGDGGYDLGARGSQIRDALLAKDTFSPEDMLTIQYDDRAVFLARWRDLILEVLTEERTAQDPRLAEYRELVASWIPRAAPESVGYRLVRAFRLEVQARVFNTLTRSLQEDTVAVRAGPLLSNQFEGVLWPLVTQQPQHLLPANYDSWDELLADAIVTNIEWFRDNFDDELANRSWGEFNTASIRHPLSRAIPALSPWLDMPADRLNGDVDVPKAQGPAFGASQRFSVSPGAEEDGLMQMPTGQSGHPLSPFYRRGHDDWVHGRPSPFLPGEPQFELTLLPLD